MAQSPLFPGGGGQLADRGSLTWDGGDERIIGFEIAPEGIWHLLERPGAEVAGIVEVAVDGNFRRLMCELHTATHILNAVVFKGFAGALVTGAQMAANGTARMDFDLPGADNDQLRRLEPELNDAVRLDLSVRDEYVPVSEAEAHYGLIRNRSVAPPPTTDGRIRIVAIVGLDRQACGGTHLPSTGALRRIQIQRIDNKGRHNRRVYIRLSGAGDFGR